MDLRRPASSSPTPPAAALRGLPRDVVRAIPRMARALPPRARRWTAIVLAVAIVLTALHYAWFRDSSLVRVSDVSVTGLTGPGAPRARAALERAATGMTTLHVREDELREAVAAEPSIRSLTATADFPHGLRIDVLENHPVAAIAIAGSGRVPLAGNGTLMPGHRVKAAVPEIRLQGAPRIGRSGNAPARLTDERAARLVRVAAAAPPPLLHRAAAIETRRGDGLVVLLRDGPRIVFGDDSRLADKWRAAAGVLASRDAQGAAYVDVRLVDRPVAGGLKPPLPEAGASTAAPVAAPAPTPAPAATTPAAPSTPTTAPAPAPPAASCQPPATCQPPAASQTPQQTPETGALNPQP